MPAPLTLPDGLTQRPLQPADAAAVTAVMAAQQLEDIGEVVIAEADIVADWQRPGYDVAASTVGVFAGDELVGYAELSPNGRGDAAVHPDHGGRGLGTALAGWMQELARETGCTDIGMPVPAGSPGDRLLAALGYRVRWTSWVLQLPAGVSIPERELPEGYTVRAATEADLEGAYQVQEAAFLEWSVRNRDSFDEWRAGTVDRPDFEPWMLRVVVDPSGQVVGMAFLVLASGSCYVDRLATRSDQRGRGIGQVLLVDSFRQGRDHEASRSELSTDSRTGALSLYEKVGMVVTSTWVNRGIEVVR